MTDLEIQELKTLLSKRDSLSKEEMSRYRELLTKEMQEELLLGDPNS